MACAYSKCSLQSCKVMAQQHLNPSRWQAIARGATVKAVMSELMGKAEGTTHGMGGSMHMYNPEHGFYGGCGIVGAQIPLGAGLAFKHHYKKDGSVAFAMCGVL